MHENEVRKDACPRETSRNGLPSQRNGVWCSRLLADLPHPLPITPLVGISAFVKLHGRKATGDKSKTFHKLLLCHMRKRHRSRINKVSLPCQSEDGRGNSLISELIRCTHLTGLSCHAKAVPPHATCFPRRMIVNSRQWLSVSFSTLKNLCFDVEVLNLERGSSKVSRCLKPSIRSTSRHLHIPLDPFTLRKPYHFNMNQPPDVLISRECRCVWSGEGSYHRRLKHRDALTTLGKSQMQHPLISAEKSSFAHASREMQSSCVPIALQIASP